MVNHAQLHRRFRLLHLGRRRGLVDAMLQQLGSQDAGDLVELSVAHLVSDPQAQYLLDDASRQVPSVAPQLLASDAYDIKCHNKRPTIVTNDSRCRGNYNIRLVTCYTNRNKNGGRCRNTQ